MYEQSIPVRVTKAFGNRIQLASILLVLSVACVHWSESKCFSIMGFSTCKSRGIIDEEYTFGVPWWFVNVQRRVHIVRRIQNRVQDTFIGSIFERNRRRSDLWQMTKTDLLEQFFLGVVHHLEEKGEAIDLLYDESLDPIILHQAFRKHHREIVDYTNEFVETADLEEDVRNYARAYKTSIEQNAVMFDLGPDPTALPFVQLLFQSDLKRDE